MPFPETSELRDFVESALSQRKFRGTLSPMPSLACIQAPTPPYCLQTSRQVVNPFKTLGAVPHIQFLICRSVMLCVPELLYQHGSW